MTSKIFPLTATRTRPSGPLPLYCFSCSIVMSCLRSWNESSTGFMTVFIHSQMGHILLGVGSPVVSPVLVLGGVWKFGRGLGQSQRLSRYSPDCWRSHQRIAWWTSWRERCYGAVDAVVSHTMSLGNVKVVPRVDATEWRERLEAICFFSVALNDGFKPNRLSWNRLQTPEKRCRSGIGKKWNMLYFVEVYSMEIFWTWILEIY